MTDLSEQIRRAFAGRAAGGSTLAEDVNFFEAGLTSARLAGVVAVLRARGIDVTLIDMFTWPTVRELTDGLTARAGRAPRSAVGHLPWER
jgi:aryl carrier-like protein